MQQVVGLLGAKGSGKDTAAKVLVQNGWKRAAFADALYIEVAEAFCVTVEFLQRRDTKETPLPELSLINCSDDVFIDVALKQMGVSRKLRRVCRTGCRVMPGQVRRLLKALYKPLSPRQVLQWWGSEYRRELCRDDYWREQVRLIIEANPDTNFVITDVRFPNEAIMVKSMGGTLARVVRPALNLAGDATMQHQSEALMANYPVDVTLTNQEGAGGIQALEQAVVGIWLPQLKAA